MLPFEYAMRNLIRDPSRFFLKTAGSCLVVLLIFGAGAFNRGMEQMLQASGSSENVIFLGAGSEESIERSEIPLQAEVQIAAGVKGIRTHLGKPAVSAEVLYMGMLKTETGSQSQVSLRGITTHAFQVYDTVRIVEGNFPRSGEVLIGIRTYLLFGLPKDELTVGSHVEFEGQQLRVSGLFDAPGSVLESEVWFTRSDLMTLTQREALSCVVVQMEDSTSFPFADLFAKQRLDLELSAIRESDYYSQLSSFYSPIRWMTWLTAALIAIGAIFGGLNMLYAAFASRISELATLQTIGFPRWAIFLSLLQESMLTTLMGTVLASVLALVLIDGREVYFSMGTFSLELNVSLIFIGIFSGILLGIIGAIPPAIRCLGAPLPSALRSS